MKTLVSWMLLGSLWLGAGPGAAETPPAGEPQAGPSASQKAVPGTSGPAARKNATMDRLELGATTITGNRELPKVMYVVPWKRADIGDLGGKPLRSLVDEVLEPVDREVFGREISYFRALEQGREPEAERPVTAAQDRP